MENKIKKCLQCNKKIEKTNKANFCSKKCFQMWRRDNQESFEYDNTDITANKVRKYNQSSLKDRVLARPFEECSFDYKRYHVIYQQNETCGRCNNSQWLGQKIPLHIDHIDGNTQNNCRENLIALCPNCHACTLTYCGRNKIKSKFPPDTEFYKIFQEKGTIRQTLLYLNLAAKGSNYEKAKRIIMRFEPEKNNTTIVVYPDLKDNM